MHEVDHAGLRQWILRLNFCQIKTFCQLITNSNNFVICNLYLPFRSFQNKVEGLANK